MLHHGSGLGNAALVRVGRDWAAAHCYASAPTHKQNAACLRISMSGALTLRSGVGCTWRGRSGGCNFMQSAVWLGSLQCGVVQCSAILCTKYKAPQCNATPCITLYNAVWVVSRSWAIAGCVRVLSAHPLAGSRQAPDQENTNSFST